MRGRKSIVTLRSQRRWRAFRWMGDVKEEKQNTDEMELDGAC
jgi:hypothetical protein